MYCEKCQRIIEEKIKYCPDCHTLLKVVYSDPTSHHLNINQQQSLFNKNSLFLITIMFPYIGVVLYLMYRKNDPQNAKVIIKAFKYYLIVFMILMILMIYCYLIR